MQLTDTTTVGHIVSFLRRLVRSFDSEVDFSYYKLEQLLYKTENPTFYPLVITLQTSTERNVTERVHAWVDHSSCAHSCSFVSSSTARTSGSGKERVVDSQTTFATLVDQQQDGYLSIRPIKVTLECNGQAYNVYDIYGINEEEDSLGIGSECVICMSEDRVRVIDRSSCAALRDRC